MRFLLSFMIEFPFVCCINGGYQTEMIALAEPKVIQQSVRKTDKPNRHEKLLCFRYAFKWWLCGVFESGVGFELNGCMFSELLDHN